MRTAFRSGEISRWDLDRLFAVAASLRHTVHPVLVPAGMKAIVTFEPA